MGVCGCVCRIGYDSVYKTRHGPARYLQKLGEMVQSAALNPPKISPLMVSTMRMVYLLPTTRAKNEFKSAPSFRTE